MSSSISSLLLLLAGIAIAFLLVGCASIGQGSTTLVPARVTDEQKAFRTYFPDLVATNPTLRALTPGATTDKSDYDSFLAKVQGCASCLSAELSVIARDRTQTPPFLPIDIGIEKQLLPIYLDKDLSSAKKEELALLAKAKILNVPDLPNRTALHDSRKGINRYFYYPRVEVDFSSKLNAASQLDRFQYLGMALQLQDDKRSDEAKGDTYDQCSPVRFIDFQPKAADIVEFARGQLTQNAQLAAKSGLSAQEVKQLTSGTSVGPTEATTTSGSQQTGTTTLTPELSLSMSETFVNALKDSIEARTVGLLEEGRTLFADFRAIKDKRIGGTYDFDVMLEVPTVVPRKKDQEYYVSIPCVSEVRADAYLVAVVRRVYKRGFTGLLTKVPEPDNDKVYLQVELQHVGNILLWQYAGDPWIKSVVRQPSEYTISVITNRSDARYVVRAESGKREVLGDGSGASSHIVIETPSKARTARVEFLDSFETDKNGTRIFEAPPSEPFKIESGHGGEITIVGNYVPKVRH